MNASQSCLIFASINADRFQKYLSKESSAAFKISPEVYTQVAPGKPLESGALTTECGRNLADSIYASFTDTILSDF